MAESLAFPRTTLWFDPGESTGWAAWVTWHHPGAPVNKATSTRFLSGQGPRHRVCVELSGLLDRFTPPRLGWEDYLQVPGQVGDPSALKVIGVLEYLAFTHHPEVLTPQASSTRNLGALHLKTVGWYVSGLRDANAAAAHLLTYLLTERQLPPDLLKLVTDALTEDPDGAR